MMLLDMLLERGLITPAQASAAQDRQRREGRRVDRALLDSGALDERQLLAVLAEHLSLPVVDLPEQKIEPQVLRCLPPKLVFHRQVVPLSSQNGALLIATNDPLDDAAFEEIRMLTGLAVRAALAPSDDIRQVIKAHYGVAGHTVDELVKDEPGAALSAAAGESEDLLQQAQEASVIKLVNEIVIEAVRERASDIHIEPYEKRLIIRYRVDGMLRDASVPPQIHQFQSAIISRVKILANLNIAEKRLPQDGRIRFQVGGRQIDVRVSVIPMLFGEGVVMRILDRAQVLFTLPQLGMSQRDFATFRELIAKPHGMILVTGPTGAGKTTTLYAALQAIVSPQIKCITIEDPVEYHLGGVNQIQVHGSVGLSFARGLRSVLRHDPDVVMIGEIRDLETAEAAIQAALTGHLVLSTLHTNDAASAPTRLLDMGVEPFLVTSTLMGAMAQRLVRRNCPDCSRPFDPEPGSLPADFDLPAGTKLQRGVGCRNCQQTGYRGRTGLYELMVLDDEVRDRIMQRASSTRVAEAARQTGLRLLREDGWDKVRAGLTTPEEVTRVTRV
jgi:general secretion pathway protein E/type IV pilus assembly protein PilB